MHALPPVEWTPGIDDIVPSELAWRFNAKCDGADENLFVMDEMGEGGSTIRTRKENVAKFAVALEYCNGCSVRRQCNESAILTGDHVWSVRGGISPYDREREVISKPTPTEDSARPGDHLRMWREFASLSPRDEAWRASELPQRDARRALDQIVGFVMDGDPTAVWQAHRNPHHDPVKPGVGWVISVNHTKDVVGLLTMERGRVTRRVRQTMKVTLSDSVNLRELPLLKVMPKGYF